MPLSNFLRRALLLGGLVGLFAFASPASAADPARPLPNNPPPALVLCRSVADCDRDPKHLEDFVAGFYKWYVTSDPIRESLHDTSPPTPQKIIWDVVRAQDQILKDRLTPAFYHWVRVLALQEDPPSDPRRCSTGSNSITCVQELYEEQMYSTTAHTDSIGTRTARVTVRLPTLADEVEYPPYHLTIELKAYRGNWRIDGILDPSWIQWLQDHPEIMAGERAKKRKP
jgi:hypothetical protein